MQTTRSRALGRWASTARVAAGGICCSTLISCGDVRDDSEARLITELGTFDVVRLGVPPVEGAITATDISDTDVVTGYVTTPTGDRPFRWQSGTFEMLGLAGAPTGQAVAINAMGDIVGRTNVAVVWLAGQSAPTPLFSPSVTALATARPNAVNRFGVVTGTLGGNAPPFYFERATGTVTYLRFGFVPLALSDSGVAIGNCGSIPMVCLIDPSVSVSDPVFHTLFVVARGPTAISSRGDFLLQGADGRGVHDHVRGLFDQTGAILPLVDPSDGMAGGDWLSVSSSLRIVGMFDEARIMISGINATTSLDRILDASGPESAAWRVRGVSKITDRHTILAQAELSGQPMEVVLLVPRRR